MAEAKRRVIAPLVIGVVGTAILIGLSVWQIQRLAWKEGLIATLEARLFADPVPLPAEVGPEDEFLRVEVTGRFEGGQGSHGHSDAPFLTTRDRTPGYRILQPFTLVDGRRIMVDRGFVPAEAKNEGGAAIRPTPAPEGNLTLTGALRFPEETADPAFGEKDNVWVARDLSAMARVFGTEPLLIVSETPTATASHGPRPMPLTVDLPNTHRNYAITWGLLALVWAVMSVIWLRRELCRG